MLLKLHSHGEVDLVVSKGAQGLGFELVPILDHHLCLMQVGGYLSGGKVDVCEREHTQKKWDVTAVSGAGVGGATLYDSSPAGRSTVSFGL